ncbi:MAG TPA: HD domain-containing protein [Usitatibacteraceae bacterium]|nr:HD domain-containing protein [Usitatibacteraceae bacterium]
MSFRRNEYDVTDRVNTTDPDGVCAEVLRLHAGLYGEADASGLPRAFADVAGRYRGEHPDFERCDTAYHDLQHVLEVALAMARLVDGYERARDASPPLGSRLFQFGVVCALFHDVGYLRRRGDRKHRRGAEYTRTHVSRGGRILRDYLPSIGMAEFTAACASVLHFTGYERTVASIRVPHPVFRLLGSLLGAADIIAQMSDRCYLEKCHDRLYPEFVDGGIARRWTEAGEEVIFGSAEDLIRKTPGFYLSATKRLERDLGGAHRYAGAHFGGENLYMAAVERNIRFAEQLRDGPGLTLRRRPPDTLGEGGTD